MTKKEQAAKERQEAVTKLREMFPPGAFVSTVLRHVSRSGMQRSISILSVEDGAPVDVSWLVARALDLRFDRDRGGVEVGGCGMDMGFHVVYEMSRRLYPDGFGCIGDGGTFVSRCPSNGHSDGDRDFTPHGHRGPRYDGTQSSLSHWHNDGGCAFRHRWV